MPRALVVDDDEHVLLFLSTVLKNLNYEVVQAPNALEGFVLLDSRVKFDLLITDVLMPIIEGSGFVKLVRQQFPDLPIVVVTALLVDDTSGKVFPPKVVILQKPLSYQQLVDGINQAVNPSL